MNKHILASALLSLTLASAQAVVVDFNGIDIHSNVGLGPNGYSIKVNEPYAEDGYLLTSNFGYKIPVGLQAVTDRSPWWTGSPALFNGWGPSAEYINATRLSRVDGESFNLLGMDAAGFSNGQSLAVYGVKQGTGAVVSQNFVLDNTPASLQALTFSADFQGIAWASIYAWNARIDNIQLSSPADGLVGNVPEPGSWALAVAGMLAVGLTRKGRRRTTGARVALGALLGLSAASAQAVVVDFNGINVSGTTNPTVTVPKPYLEDGFSLNTYSGSPYTHYAGGTVYALTPAHGLWTGSPSVYSGVITNYGSGFILSRSDGGVFDLISMDAAPFSSAGGYRNFTVFGYPLGASGYVRQDFVLDASYQTLETLSFDSRFKNLTSIQFSSVYAQVDNIQLRLPGEGVAPVVPVVPGVPEPESLVLALIGVGMVLGARRWRA